MRRFVFVLAFGAVAALPAAADPVFRTIDGTGNNITNPDWGAAGAALLRAGGPAYADGIAAPIGGASSPNPRAISNAVVAQPAPLPNGKGASDYLWAWGQFLDHDLDLTTANPAEPFNIAVPPGDPRFPPGVIPFNRSNVVAGTGTSTMIPRQQPNVLTAYIDASMVYGSDEATALSLRTGAGGLLKTFTTPTGDLLPLKAPDGTIKSGSATFIAGDLFLAGDARVNENVVLTSLHTLFVREHNRLAAEIAAANPAFNDERIYQEARKIVGAEIQSITYNEFLPLLIGASALPAYGGYDASVNAGIRTEFSTAGFRLGHTLLSAVLRRVDETGATIPAGDVALRDAFFRPDRVIAEGGIAPLLLGLARQRAREVDRFIVEDVRSFLFGPPGAGGLDLAALNIQRGRDHGLLRYNATRGAYGLEMFTGWDDPDLPMDEAVKAALMSVYLSLDDVDLWIGGLSERHHGASMLGELFTAIVAEQFLRLRAGDWFWYENDAFEPAWVEMIEDLTLGHIIALNTGMDSMPRFAFMAIEVPEPGAAALFALGLGLALTRRRRSPRAANQVLCPCN